MSSSIATLISGLCLAATIQSSMTTANHLLMVARMVTAAQRSENSARVCGENAAMLENLRDAKTLLSSWSHPVGAQVSGVWNQPSEALMMGDCRLTLDEGAHFSGSLYEFSFQPHHERNLLIDSRLPNWRPRLRLEGNTR